MTALRPSLSPDEAVANLVARLARPARLLVAVSGGSDSLGLLLALARCLPDGITLLAVTIDHCLRPASAQEAAEVGRICRELGISHAVKRWSGEKPDTGLAAAAREARYGLLCDAADEAGATAILTGHTLDDQIETVTMRAARSPDPSAHGLAGMAEAVLLHRRHWLLRPFLGTRRVDIRALLQDLGQSWIDDPSNADRRSERVRTRLALADGPGIRIDEIEAAGLRRRQTAEAAAAWLSDHVAMQHSVLMHVGGEGLGADPAVLRYALSCSIAVLGGREQGPAGDSLQRIVLSCRRDAPWKMTAGRVVIDRRQSGLYLCREARNLPPLCLRPGDTVTWDNRFRIAVAADAAPFVACNEVPGSAAEIFADVPGSVARRAVAALPPVPRREGVGSTLICTPVLAPYDRFLPQFDLNLASTLAKLVGCDDFPPLPTGDSVRKR